MSLRERAIAHCKNQRPIDWTIEEMLCYEVGFLEAITLANKVVENFERDWHQQWRDQLTGAFSALAKPENPPGACL